MSLCLLQGGQLCRRTKTAFQVSFKSGPDHVLIALLVYRVQILTVILFISGQSFHQGPKFRLTIMNLNLGYAHVIWVLSIS